MTDDRRLPSLRTELLANLAALAAGALMIAVSTMALLYLADAPVLSPWLLGVLIAADVLVFVAFGAYLLRRMVLAPLADAVAAAEAIAEGDLERRVPAGNTRELQGLARSVNRMTTRLLADRTQLVRAEKLASVGRLGAGIAHEIGNPLGAIHGYVHLLKAQVGAQPAALDAIAGLERESARIDRIVRGLLDYARPRRASPATLDVRDAARSAAELLGTQGALRGVRLQLDLPGAPLPVHGDLHELEQLFVNLLLNAVDAMDGDGSIVVHAAALPVELLSAAVPRRAGDPAGTVRDREPHARAQVWLRDHVRARTACKVVVADSGPGVPPADAERIFDPFFTTKEPGKGTGLGLALVARVADTLRGAIWVEESREGGAAFHLLLPLADEPTVVAARLSRPEEAHA